MQGNIKNYKMKKTVLVAGGTGNLGRRIISALIARGAEVLSSHQHLLTSHE
jgi:nucleoside-diphosphate-sugar epimerase